MPLLETVWLLLASVFDLLKASFILAIPVFVFVFLGSKLKQWLAKKYKLSWVQAAFLATYIITTLLIFVLYYGILYYAIAGYSLGPLPEEIHLDFLETFSNSLSFFVLDIIKRILVGLALSVVLLPFAFIGSAVLDWLKGRKQFKKTSQWLLIFAATFACTLIALLLLLAFDWILAGVIYLVFSF